MATRKYYKKRSDAVRALEERRRRDPFFSEQIGIHRMPKGTRHHGEWAVCSYMEFINTY